MSPLSLIAMALVLFLAPGEYMTIAVPRTKSRKMPTDSETHKVFFCSITIIPSAGRRK